METFVKEKLKSLKSICMRDTGVEGDNIQCKEKSGVVAFVVNILKKLKCMGGVLNVSR